MYLPPNGPRLHARAGQFVRHVALLLAVLIPALHVSAAFAQHVANPFVGATQYVNPDYATEVNGVIAQTSNTTLVNQMKVLETYPTAVWMDHIGAIAGGAANGGKLGLSQHIARALSQQVGTTPVVITLVIYDLPQRDCAALASNGEISIAANPPTQPLTGIQTYEQNYITPIFNILAPFASNPNLRFVLIIEPDSLPNLITNTGLSSSIANCLAANNGMSSANGTAQPGSVYVQGIQYALTQFHTLQNAYQYLDIGQSAWLGWPANLAPAVSLFKQVVAATPAGLGSADGFISNTANYVPTKEPFLTASEQIGGNPVDSANFFQFNPNIDEADYDAALYSAFVAAGFPASIGFLIDTSRNGWGGPARPTGPSISTDLNTFVNGSKIDERNARGQWCNQSNSGLGVPPTANPGFFPQLQAFVWIKPPGESDGTYATSTAFVGGNADENCDPAHSNALANNTLTGSIPNPPSAGVFFPAEFTLLIQNALPAVPATTTAGFTVSAAGVTVEQGTSATDSVTVSSINGFNGAISLSVSGLPSGVTATFNPSSVTGSTGSSLTFTASNTATVGAATVTVTGTSGSITSSASLVLNVTAEPNFTISAAPSSITVPAATSGAVSISIGYVGGLTGSVSISASDLPSGISANFSPSSVNSSGSVSVSFFVQSGTAPGTSNVTVTGTNGTITHSVAIALTIPGASSFALSRTAAALTVTRGNSVTDTITVTGVGGFAGSVTLAASGMPTGVTASFGTNPTTGTSVLNLAANSSAATGTSTLTITGTSGSLSATTTIGLTVNAVQTPSFALSPSATTLAVTQGSRATDAITVTDLGGFAGSVTLAAAGLPSGVTASFGTNPTTGSSVLSLTASSTATAGTSSVTISGTSGTLTATTSIGLTVNASSAGGFACHIGYTISSQWQGGFGAAITINNTGTTSISNWTLTWTFPNGQTVTQLWNGIETQSGADVSVANESYNGSIPSGGNYSGMGFNGAWNNTSNAAPASFAVNGVACQ